MPRSKNLTTGAEEGGAETSSLDRRAWFKGLLGRAGEAAGEAVRPLESAGGALANLARSSLTRRVFVAAGALTVGAATLPACYEAPGLQGVDVLALRKSLPLPLPERTGTIPVGMNAKDYPMQGTLTPPSSNPPMKPARVVAFEMGQGGTPPMYVTPGTPMLQAEFDPATGRWSLPLPAPSKCMFACVAANGLIGQWSPPVIVEVNRDVPGKPVLDQQGIVPTDPLTLKAILTGSLPDPKKTESVLVSKDNGPFTPLTGYQPKADRFSFPDADPGAYRFKARNAVGNESEPTDEVRVELNTAPAAPLLSVTEIQPKLTDTDLNLSVTVDNNTGRVLVIKEGNPVESFLVKRVMDAEGTAAFTVIRESDKKEVHACEIQNYKGDPLTFPLTLTPTPDPRFNTIPAGPYSFTAQNPYGTKSPEARLEVKYLPPTVTEPLLDCSKTLGFCGSNGRQYPVTAKATNGLKFKPSAERVNPPDNTWTPGSFIVQNADQDGYGTVGPNGEIECIYVTGDNVGPNVKITVEVVGPGGQEINSKEYPLR